MATKLTRTRIGIAILLLVAAGLVGARFYLPCWVKDYVNSEINRLEGYSGGVQAVGISLWRGAHQVYRVVIRKTSNGQSDPFVAAEKNRLPD